MVPLETSQESLESEADGVVPMRTGQESLETKENIKFSGSSEEKYKYGPKTNQMVEGGHHRPREGGIEEETDKREFRTIAIYCNTKDDLKKCFWKFWGGVGFGLV